MPAIRTTENISLRRASLSRDTTLTIGSSISNPSIIAPFVPGAGYFGDAGCSPIVSPFPASTVAQLSPKRLVSFSPNTPL